MLNVFGVDFVVFDQVAQNARQERNVRTGTNRCVNIRHRSGTRKTRIDNDQGCIVVVFASIAQRKPTGCASAALPPITITTLAFLISTQWLVIAPRPNVEQDFATVGPCQTRARLSTASILRERANFCVSIPVSLLAPEAIHSIPVESQRFTVTPCSFFSIKLASRSAFISFAIRENASSQLMRCHLSEPGARYSG